MNSNFLSLSFVLCFYIISCVSPEEHPVPKPISYFRIDFPEKKYTSFMDSFPYVFDIPVYSQIRTITGTPSCDKVLVFQENKADLLFKYSTIDTSLSVLTENIKNNAYSHSFKANSISFQPFVNNIDSVYGITYEITGNVGCNYMFYLTDSINHLLIGELMFRANPNYDSLQPVIEFIKSDIKHLIETFKWKG